MKRENVLNITGVNMAARQTFDCVKWLKTVFLMGALVIFFSGQSLAESPAVNVAVEIGQSQILTVGSDIREAAIGNTDIADIRLVTPRKLLIIGKTLGNTNLILWDAADQTTFFNLDVAAHQHQQIVLQVKVAEVGRSALRDLGINFSSMGPEWGGASYAGGSFARPAGTAMAPGVALGSDVTAALVQFPSNINAMIKALDKKGLYKTLAEPNLVVKSGERGKFIAGQRIPFTMSSTGATGGTTSDVRFEEVGVKLDFAPIVLKDGYINLKIDPVEVSTIDPSTPTVLSAGQFPIINKRATSTVVDLKEGESLVLAGLISNEASRAISKFPILGDIPILGALFRSKNFQNKETELIFIITPFVKKPIGKGEEQPDLKAMTTITPGEEDKMRWIPLVPYMSEDVVKEDKKEEDKKEETKKE